MNHWNGIWANIYRPQTKFAKVIFLHVSVSHSVHRGGGGCVPGVGVGYVPWGGHAWLGRGVCVAGGHACLGRGACVPYMPPPGLIQDTVGQWAGGTYPTGMHSCLFFFWGGGRWGLGWDLFTPTDFDIRKKYDESHFLRPVHTQHLRLQFRSM